MAEVKRIPISEFRERGYLQEINRQFLHPLGLALEVIVEEDGTERLGGVWDCRDDPVGVYYGPGIIDREKAVQVAREREEREGPRREVLGYIVQTSYEP